MKKIFVTLGIAAIAVIGMGVFYSCTKEEPLSAKTEGISSVKQQKEMNKPEDEKYYILNTCFYPNSDGGYVNGTYCDMTISKPPACCKPHRCKPLPGEDAGGPCLSAEVNEQLNQIATVHGGLLYYKEFISEFRPTFDYLYEIGELTVTPDVLYERVPTKDEYYAAMR